MPNRRKTIQEENQKRIDDINEIISQSILKQNNWKLHNIPSTDILERGIMSFLDMESADTIESVTYRASMMGPGIIEINFPDENVEGEFIKEFNKRVGNNVTSKLTYKQGEHAVSVLSGYQRTIIVSLDAMAWLVGQEAFQNHITNLQKSHRNLVGKLIKQDKKYTYEKNHEQLADIYNIIKNNIPGTLNNFTHTDILERGVMSFLGMDVSTEKLQSVFYKVATVPGEMRIIFPNNKEAAAEFVSKFNRFISVNNENFGIKKLNVNDKDSTQVNVPLDTMQWLVSRGDFKNYIKNLDTHNKNLLEWLRFQDRHYDPNKTPRIDEEETPSDIIGLTIENSSETELEPEKESDKNQSAAREKAKTKNPIKPAIWTLLINQYTDLTNEMTKIESANQNYESNNKWRIKNVKLEALKKIIDCVNDSALPERRKLYNLYNLVRENLSNAEVTSGIFSGFSFNRKIGFSNRTKNVLVAMQNELKEKIGNMTDDAEQESSYDDNSQIKTPTY